MGTEKLGKITCGERRAIEPALAAVAAEVEEHVRLSFCFDSLRDRSEAETITKTDDGGDYLSALAGVRHLADEAGIDFEFIEGKRLKMAEAGVTSAEVIERERDTERLHFLCNGVCLVDIVDECAFGNFED